MLPEEKTLFEYLAEASELIRAEVERERFVEAMGVMARLRGPVDAFFEHVTVNDPDPALRENRLCCSRACARRCIWSPISPRSRARAFLCPICPSSPGARTAGSSGQAGR